MNCAICGKPVPESNLDCPNCGTAVNRADSSQAWTPSGTATSGEPLDARSREPVLEPLPGEFRSEQPIPGVSGHAGSIGYAAATPGTPPGSASGYGSGSTGTVQGSDATEAATVTGRRAPRRRTALIIVLVTLAVLLGGGFLTYQVFGRQIRRSILGPKKSYLLLEATALKDGMEQMSSGLVAAGGKEAPKAGGAEMDLSLKLAASLPGIDPQVQNLVNSLKLRQKTVFDTRQSGPQQYSRTDILLNSEQLLGLEAFVAKDQLTVGLPGLLSQYVAIPVRDLEKMITEASGVEVSFNSLVDRESAATPRPVDKLQLAASFAKVADVLLTNIEDATFADRVPLTVGSLTQEFECYTIRSNGQQLRDMAVGILTLIRDEKPLTDLLYPSTRGFRFNARDGESFTSFLSMPGMDPMTEAEWKAMLTEGIDRLNALKDADLQDMRLTQKVYFDKNDQVHGREFTVEKDSTKDTATLRVLNLVKDNQHAQLIGLTGMSGDRSMPGNDSLGGLDIRDIQLVTGYTIENDAKTGTADLMFNGVTAATVTFRDVASQKVGDHELMVGTFDINLASDMVGFRMPIPKIGVKGSVNGGRYLFSIDVASYATLTADVALISEADAKIPSLSGQKLVQVTDEQDLAELMTFDVQMKLLMILQKLGIDPMMLS